MIGKYVIVRCQGAGVHAGILKEKAGDEVTLADSRRLWHWDGACSLSQLAVDGTNQPDGCKFTVTVDEIMLLGAIEIIPATARAEKSIREVTEWRR